MNLLTETLEALKGNGKGPQDVLWVGSHDGKHAVTWDEFAQNAKEIDYDSGYGGQRVPADLVVVGTDWWLERSEYDGSEWWTYKKSPITSPPDPIKFTLEVDNPNQRYGWSMYYHEVTQDV